MHVIRNHIATKVFSLLMAVHILNFSVDAPSLPLVGDAENLYFNDMESIAEWAMEGLLEVEDFFPEYQDGQSGDDAHTFKPLKVLSMPGYEVDFPAAVHPTPCLRKSRICMGNEAFLPQGCPDIIAPPPDLPVPFEAAAA